MLPHRDRRILDLLPRPHTYEAQDGSLLSPVPWIRRVKTSTVTISPICTGCGRVSMWDFFPDITQETRSFQIWNPQQNQPRNQESENMYYNIIPLQEFEFSNQQRDVTVLKESTVIKWKERAGNPDTLGGRFRLTFSGQNHIEK